MNWDMNQVRLSLVCTCRHSPSRLCCWVFSLRLAISSYRLIYPDKLDLIHRLLSSIYFATGLCHPIDIRTEWWYQISYSGCKSSGRIEMCCDMRVWGYFTTAWTSMIYIQVRPHILLHWKWFVFILYICVVLLFPELPGHSLDLLRDQLFQCSLSWEQAYVIENVTLSILKHFKSTKTHFCEVKEIKEVTTTLLNTHINKSWISLTFSLLMP